MAVRHARVWAYGCKREEGTIPHQVQGCTSHHLTTACAPATPPPPSFSLQTNIVPYQVTVITSDIRGAGTDGEVFLALKGEHGAMGETRLEVRVRWASCGTAYAIPGVSELLWLPGRMEANGRCATRSHNTGRAVQLCAQRAGRVCAHGQRDRRDPGGHRADGGCEEEWERARCVSARACREGGRGARVLQAKAGACVGV